MESLKEKKLVTIGLPVYNGERTMRRAIDSLLAQTYPHFEFIISDDASTDETPAICKEYADKDKRVRYIRHEKNTGHFANIYFVVREARGDYCMLAGDDDWWEPDYLEKLVSALDQNPAYGIAMGSFDRMYEDGEVRDVIHLEGKFDLTSQGHIAVCRKMMFGLPIHIYMYGLFRTSLMRRWFKRPPPHCIRWDRVVLTELTLATRFYSVKDMVFHRQDHRTSVYERYKKQAVGSVYANPYARTRYVWTMGMWSFTSPLVPVHRKLIFFFLWLLLIWRRRKVMFREIFSHKKIYSIAKDE